MSAIAWSPDGQLLAISAGNQMNLVRASDQQPVVTIKIGALTPALAFSPDQRYLAGGSRDGYLRVWDVTQFNEGLSREGGLVPVWQTLAHRKGVNDLAFSPDGQRLASGGNDGMARIWNAASGKPESAIIGGAFAIPGLDFNPRGDLLAIANSNLIRLRDTSSGRIVGSFRSENPLFSLDFHPGGNLLAAGDSENSILLWDPAGAFRTGAANYPIPIKLQAHSGKPNSSQALIWEVAFSPDGRYLASAGGDGSVILWDVQSRAPRIRLTGHRAAVTSLAFSPDGRSLATGSLDGKVRIWDLGDL